jgi:hypothetical protein
VDRRETSTFVRPDNQSFDIKSTCKSFLRESEVSNQKRKHKFTWYLIFVCFASALFYLFYFIFDQTFYDHAEATKIVNVNLTIYNRTLSKIREVYSNRSRNDSMMRKIINENIKNEELLIGRFYRKALLRVPLLLINIPHVIKFYLLTFFYARFRHELSLFFCLRFYFNSKLARRVTVFGKKEFVQVKFSPKQNSLSELKKSKEEHLESIEKIDIIQTKRVVGCKKLEVKHRFDLFCCLIAKHSQRAKKNSKKSLKSKNKRTNHVHDKANSKRKRIKDILVSYDSDGETESSSIVGYKSPTINSSCVQTVF